MSDVVERLGNYHKEPCECYVEFNGGQSIFGTLTVHTSIKRCARCRFIDKHGNELIRLARLGLAAERGDGKQERNEG